MLPELGVLMVPPSRGGCYIQRKASLLCLDASDSIDQSGSHEDFNLGGIAAGLGLGEEEEEAGPVVSVDRFLAPAFAIAAATPRVDGLEFGRRPNELQSVMTNSKDFCTMASAQNGFFAPCGEHTGEGMIRAAPNGGPGPAGKENGFGIAEKRTRNGEVLGSPEGNHSGDSFSKRVFQEGPEGPLRKRPFHVCENDLDDLGGERGEANGVTPSDSNSRRSVDTPTQLDDRKLSNSEENGRLPAGLPPTPLRTEGNAEGGDDEGRVVEDFEMSPEGLEGTTEEDANGHPSSGPMAKENPAAATEATDMEVDANSSGNIVAEGTPGRTAEEAEEVGGGDVPMHLQSIGVQRDVDGGEVRVPMFGDSSEETKRESSNTIHHLNQAEPIGVHPPPGNGERNRELTPADFPQARPVVEVIEVDDSDDEPAEMNAHESDGSSTKGKKPNSEVAGLQRRGGYRLSSSDFSADSESPDDDDDDSDSDDCQVLGSLPPNGQRDRSANPVVVEEDEESDTESDESDSSDVEVVGGSQSAIRRMWEEAAMRRRMGRAMQSEGSKANGDHEGTVNLDEDRTESQGLAESVATSTYYGSPDSKDQTETSEACGGLEGLGNRTVGMQGSSSVPAGEGRPPGTPERDDVDYIEPEEVLVTSADSERVEQMSSPGADQGDTDHRRVVKDELHGGSEQDNTMSVGAQSESHKGASSPGADRGGNERLQEGYMEHEGFRNEMREQDGSVVGDEAGVSTASEDFLAAKERLKQTPHYRKTDAAEWASRQQEIQRQAVETKRLRQRKRQEADRKKEMERKQKERIDELRMSQMKEERSMDLREHLRGQVRAELERVAATCYDFATLLRQFGIPVDGGRQPSTQQVNAAYKKALFKFHPDRAVASSKGEPRQQVEAEEKFKILRSKKNLVPVAIDYSYQYR